MFALLIGLVVFSLVGCVGLVVIRKPAPTPLSGLFVLSHRIQVFVPSTVDVNKQGINQQTDWINQLIPIMADRFGGATEYQANGAWDSDQSGIVREGVVIVESYCTPQAKAQYLDLIVTMARTMKDSMGQEAISLIVDDQMYLV
jgi:hypothetical protein